MFLSVSHFTVANDLDGKVREAFCQRPHLVDDAPGFIRMEVANPCDDAKEFWLLTWWKDEASFATWHRSHAYKEAHLGIPKGLKLDPAKTRVMGFEVFAS